MDAYSRELQLRAQELEIEGQLALRGYNEAKAVLDKFLK